MLVLKIYRGRRIVLPEVGVTIELQPHNERDGRAAVRLGIDAPDDIRILREEIATPEDLAVHVRSGGKDLREL